ncbi:MULTISPECIES: CopD family protein [Shewanella]|jgi:putative copper resistance protein D|uniref:copper resistance D family protein n=1 Tax=Shewanella TaxID=22 RepID=UPI000CC39E18|nr:MULTISPECIES: CopD family protein [Shewanella]PIX69807.1 MAG: copper resistance protein CopD [Shewanella sp. CG_4_10_14_3_um_filter_42_91]PIY67571.1 MAG: copper resistance protein CopD [Shewanella sp. CG_4_10_14_0_8_um_filter_42_13]RPA35169.1 copper resistance protein CopD [Shewanella vesiculosa]UJL44159.1 CopD family protein [Shewanella vesiculosa]
MILTVFEISVLISKWVIYLSVAAVIGGTLMQYLIKGQPNLGISVAKYTGVGAVLGLIAVSINYFAQVGAFAESGLMGIFDAQMHAFLWPTQVGQTVLWRLIGFGLMLVASGLLLHKNRYIKTFSAVLAILSCLLIAVTFTFIGHSTELGLLAQGLILIHVLIIGSWIGAFYPLWKLCSTDDNIVIKNVMDTFGRLGIVIVILVLLSGMGMVWMLFDSPTELISSDYGIAVTIKLCLVAIILLIAAWHKLVLVPKLTIANPSLAKQKLQKSIGLEALIAVLILATTAVLSSVLGPMSLG